MISTWSLTLPSVLRPFDYTTISDVVVTVRYTALEDGDFRETVEEGITTRVGAAGLGLVVSLAASFPAELEQLKAGATSVPVDLTEIVPGFLKAAGAQFATTGGVMTYSVGEDGTISELAALVSAVNLTATLTGNALPSSCVDVLLSVKLTIA